MAVTEWTRDEYDDWEADLARKRRQDDAQLDALTQTVRPMTLSLIIPRTGLLTSNMRLHWARKARLTGDLRRQAAAKWRLAHQHGFPPMPAAHVTATLQFPDNRRRDPANWAPTAKACIDGFVSGHRDIPGNWVGVLPDDDHRHLVGPDMRIREPSRELVGRVRIDFHFQPITKGQAS